MKLLYPEFLYALGFLVIPILIHLFNFRKYKVIRFPQVRFLQDVQKQTQSTSRLKHLLVLLSRLLLLTALILAFCLPYFPNEESALKQGRKGVSIYLDNSFSMQSKEEDGQLFDLAKNKALAVLDAYSAADKFQLLTNDFEGKHQRWLNKSAFVDALQEVEISPSFRDIKAVVQRQEDGYEKSGLIPRQYLISDLQKVSFNLEEIETDSLSLNVLPMLANENQNIGLLSMEFNSPYRLKGQREAIGFTVKNFNDKEIDDLSVQFTLNNQMKAPLSISIPSKDTVEKEFQYRSASDGWQKGTIAIKDYPINFDDSLYFSYSISKSIQLLHLYNDTLNNKIQRLFENDSFISYQSQLITNIDFQGLNKQNFIILDQLINISSGLQNALTSFVEDGGSLLLIPNEKMVTNTYNKLLQKLNIDQYTDYRKDPIQLAEINTTARLYRDVFTEKVDRIKLPEINGYWGIQQLSKSKKEILLNLVNGRPFLNEYKVEKGKVFLMTTGLRPHENNFARHAIFVPTLYNMALQSETYAPPYYVIGDDNILLSNIKQQESPVRIVGNGIDFIPPQKYIQNLLQLQLHNEVKTAGHYELWQKDEQVGLISLNYNRVESDLSRYTINDLEALAKRSGINLTILEEKDEQLSNQVSYLEQGTPLWKYFIIFALVFLAIEVILLRILK